MNFKPTLLKGVISLIIVIIVDIIMSSLVIVLDAPKHWYDFIFYPNLILISLLIGIVFYVIWSLFQGRKNRFK